MPDENGRAGRSIAPEANSPQESGRSAFPYGAGRPKATKPGMAWCNICKRWRKLDQFRANREVHDQCRECVAAYDKAYRRGTKRRLILRGMQLAADAIEAAMRAEKERGDE